MNNRSAARYYLAIDIGASSGRHILGHVEDGRIVTEEIHRFANGNKTEDGHRVWDTDSLFREILTGMRKCGEAGKIPVSAGIDTWAVDYVLLDKDGERLGKVYAYRDARTAGMDAEVRKVISDEDLYRRTGIQKNLINTIYQLTALKRQEPELLEKAQALLMIPDYFHYLLTGVQAQEYTNASTTQLVDPVTNEWDRELIRMLGLPERLFGRLSMPGTVLGDLKEEIRDIVGYNCRIVLPATHDTGSAVMSVPVRKGDDREVLYISSGTWSLLGCELAQADTGEAAAKANFTNEGGYDHRYRFLKNIMGLWMIQSVRKELEEKDAAAPSFAELCELAEAADISSVVDADSTRFLAPDSMTGELQAACRETGQQVPETPGELARVIYRSLAESYKRAVRELETITGRTYPCINIVGGGSNADYLNRLTAKATGKQVIPGPGEATAIGNLGAQMIADSAFADLACFRDAVYRSVM